MRETQELLIKTPTRLLVASRCTGRILLAVITIMVLFAFIAIVQEAQAVVTTVTSNVNPGWTNNRQEVVFYNGDRFYLLYSKGGSEIFYKSSRDNVTWSGESTLISGASSTFNTYLVNDEKFDLTYRGFPSYTFVRTCTISCGTITCGSASTVETAIHTAVAVARSGGDRIYFVGQFNSDYLRMYSANQTGDASSSMTWTQRVNNTGADPTYVAAVPYQSVDKVLAVYQNDGGGTGNDGVRSIVLTSSGTEGEQVLYNYGNLPDFSSPIRISDTDFRIIVRPPGAAMEEWKWNGSSWNIVDTNIDPQGETDQNSPSLFYDRISGDMYAFSVDTGADDMERHKKPSGGSWETEVVADDGEATTHTYPTTQMHEPPPGSGRTVPRELVWAFRVVNGSNYDLKVGNLRLASPPAPSVAGYTCYRTIRVDHNKISGTAPLTDFPLLVKFENDSNLVTGTCGWAKSTYGWDIIFTDDSDTPTVQYDHEIEKFDGAAGTLFAWVRIPSLSATAYTDLRMWYGNSGASDSSNPNGVWDCNYQGVWHLKENPEDAAPEFNDSTANGNNGSAEASMDSTDQVEGQIDGSIDLNDNSNQYINAGTSASLNPTNYITVEAWVSVTDTGDQDRAFVVKGNGTIDDDGSNPYAYALWSEGNDSCDQVDFCINDVDNDGSNCVEEGSAPGLCGSGWHHLVGTYDGTALRIFIDGNPEQTKALASATITQGTSYPVVFGRDSLSGSKYTGGTFDEVRISNIARSAEWIEAEYKNVTDSSFYTVTYESCGAPHEDPNTFSCSRTIRVDHTKVSDLDGVSYYENFPMLVKFTGDNTLKFGSCGRIKQADGSDIIFTDSNGYVLDHEIESYDGDTGTLVAWVKIPQLYTGQATDITMHYGKEVLQCATENPTGVWDDDYVAVWHLKESSGTGSYAKNSKQDAYHGNPSGSNFIENAKIAGGRQVNQPVEFDNGGDLLDGDTAFTLSFWGYPNYTSDSAWNNAEEHMFNTDSIWGLRWGHSGWIQADVHLTSGTQYFNDSDPLLREQWHYLVLNFDGSRLRWYKDGDVVGVSSDYTGQALVSNSIACLGYCYGGGGVSYMDEVRYSRSARTAGWIATEYANQNDPGSFYQKIDDTCESGGGGSYSYCKKIIIDRGNVTAPSSPGYLADFPFLVKITNNDDLKNGVTSAEGWDIIFLGDSCTPLSHEIESYDPDTGSLLAWVKIPQLNGSTLSSDTVIYMKYGNASVVCNNDDPPGVWDDNYVGVWHLKDLTTSSTKDSTSNSNEGTKKAANEPAEVDGNIAKAQNFGNDGSVDDYINISSVSDDVDVNKGTFELWLKREFADSGGGGSCAASPMVYSAAVSTTYTVPTGCDTLTVKAWGAGGGGGGKNGEGGAGGGGGFAQADISVTPGESLSIVVGGGGAGGAGGSGTGGGTTTPTAGGGSGGNQGDSEAGGGGGGGGYAAVKRGSTYLVEAGGGGGGGGVGKPGRRGGAGGAGGGWSGVAGSRYSSGGYGGGAGTSSAAGSGGSTGGTAGTWNQGGNGGYVGSNANGGGGGGGSGRYGGGGGGSTSSEYGGGGGGGGSARATGTNTSATAGSGTTPGNNSDSYYGNNAGVGGAAGANGNPGRIVVIPSDSGGGGGATMSIMRVDTDSQNGITLTYDQSIEKFRFRHEAGDTEIKVERASSEIPLNTWTHAAMTWDKSAGEFKAYINGSQVGTTQTGLGTWAGTVAYGNLGRRYDNQEFYDGSLDEARISNIARSAEWIKTACDNQNNPESFITLGSCLNKTIAVEDQWKEEF